jgi:S-adenosylmethionine decarboxylase
MFPERQLGPHKDWRAEIEYLDAIFKTGAAYTVGKVNGDHWLLYMTSPCRPPEMPPAPPPPTEIDYTIEILMTHLDPGASQHFFNSYERDAQKLSSALGITDLFPPHLTTLDAYSFNPCGYSSNALLKWPAPDGGGEGYYTIHVTPEEGWSYASFECNVPLPANSPDSENIPDLKTLVRRVVSIFKPSKLSLTLFISSEHNSNAEDDRGENTIETAQRAFRVALTTSSEAGVYKRTDKINYEFGAYDLAFASFELLDS